MNETVHETASTLIVFLQEILDNLVLRQFFETKKSWRRFENNLARWGFIKSMNLVIRL